MLLTIKNGWLYLVGRWDSMTDEEYKFVSKCYFSGGIWGDFDEDGDCPMRKVESAITQEFLANGAINYAYEYGISIDEGVSQFVKKVMEVANEERSKTETEKLKRREREAKERLITNALSKMESGCGLCEHLKLESGEHICKYANKKCRKLPDEVEYEFEVWKECRALKTQQTWYARPFPCNGCLYVEEGRKAEEELLG
jgi:hypothetical protein